VSEFNTHESEAIAESEKAFRGHWIHWLGPQGREAIPLKTEAAYAVGPPDARIYYFEAIRQYPSSPSSSRHLECATLSYGAGWFAGQGDVLRPLGFSVTRTGCNREGLLYMLPLGAVKVSNRLFWITQWSGWGYEEYDVVEIKPKQTEVILSVFGGRC
jgi:hypothetical protein